MKRFFKLFTFTFLLFSQLAAYSLAGILVISDVDDTLRISNSNSRLGMATALKNKSFVGMAPIFHGLQDLPVQFQYLSAAPESTRVHMEDFIARNTYPSGPLTMKGRTSPSRTFEYKTQAILRYLEQNPEDSVILIGDDQQVDPEVYSKIRERFPNRVLGAYIHVIRGRTLPANVTSYLIPLELAVLFYQSQWIRATHLANIYVQTQAVKFNRKDRALLIPSFQICPKNYRMPYESVNSLDFAEITSLVQTICKSRK